MITSFVCLFAVMAAQAKAAPAPGTPVVPVLTMTGDRSRTTGPRAVVCGDQKSLDEVWSSHTGAPAKVYYTSQPAPQVDFKRYMVVFIFSGSGVNSQGLNFESIMEGNDSLVVRYSDLGFQTMNEPQLVQTWGMAVLPRSTKRIVVEHGTRDRIGDPLHFKKEAEVRLGEDNDSYRMSRRRPSSKPGLFAP